MTACGTELIDLAIGVMLAVSGVQCFAVAYCGFCYLWENKEFGPIKRLVRPA